MRCRSIIRRFSVLRTFRVALEAAYHREIAEDVLLLVGVGSDARYCFMERIPNGTRVSARSLSAEIHVLIGFCSAVNGRL